MTRPGLQSLIDAAAQYERLFVPAEFREWAPRLLDALGVTAGQTVLDVACGTGVLTREAASRVGPAGLVVGLDGNPGMLSVAANLAPTVRWCHGDAELLPFRDGAFDAIACQFGLMFFTDRRQALLEMRRVLAPGGRLAVAVWDSLERTPAYAVLVQVVERVERRAADALRVPFRLGNPDELAALFASADLSDITIDARVGTAQFASVRLMVEAELEGWLPVAGVELSDDQRNRVLAEAERVLSRFVASDGTIRFESPAHIVTTTAP